MVYLGILGGIGSSVSIKNYAYILQKAKKFL
jgi:hypothetical protein